VKATPKLRNVNVIIVVKHFGNILSTIIPENRNENRLDYCVRHITCIKCEHKHNCQNCSKKKTRNTEKWTNILAVHNPPNTLTRLPVCPYMCKYRLQKFVSNKLELLYKVLVYCKIVNTNNSKILYLTTFMITLQNNANFVILLFCCYNSCVDLILMHLYDANNSYQYIKWTVNLVSCLASRAPVRVRFRFITIIRKSFKQRYFPKVMKTKVYMWKL
jgi:hypothetical protein